MTTITDDFNRADSSTTPNPASDGGSWTASTELSTAVYGILSNQLYCVNAGSGDLPLRRNTFQCDADWTVTNARANTSGFSYLWLAYDPVAGTGYRVQYDASGIFSIWKWASGSPTQLGTDFGGVGWTGTTSILRATYVSATGVITVFQGGGSIGSRTDGSPLTASTNSWVGANTSQNHASTGETWGDFTATASPPPPTPVPRLIVVNQAVQRAANW